jgi:cyclase
MFYGADVNIFERAKALRKQQTPAEETLWLYLKQKPLGYKFRRQHPLGIYILDFYCHQLKLGIEVDGPIHNTTEIKLNDLEREQMLKQLNIEILRFTNDLILTCLQEVQQQVEQIISSLKTFPKNQQHF